MSLLGDGAAFLVSTLPTEVTYRVEGQADTTLRGAWVGESYDSRGKVGIGAQRYEGRATFHVEQSELTHPNKRAVIVYNGDIYKIAHAEPVQAATWRLMLERVEHGGASPMRPMGRR